MTIRERWLPIALAGVFVVAMVACSEFFSSPEVLFPEMTAILCGAWISPRQVWRVDRPRMIALMGAGACFGLVVNLLFPDALLALRAIVGYAFCAVMMCATGAEMAPMLSATILPMVLGTDSWVYPAAVVTMVVLVCAGQIALEHLGLREKIGEVSVHPGAAANLRAWTPRLVTFALLAGIAYSTGNVFFAVPPLVVAFTEMAHTDFSLRDHPVRAWAVLAGAAVIGGLARNAVELVGLPLWVTAAAAYVALVLVWNALRTWMPPAGAVVLLALLVPWQGPWLYMLEVSAGAALWTAAGVVLAQLAQRGESSNREEVPRASRVGETTHD